MATTIRVATFNVRNLVRPGVPYRSEPGSSDVAHREKVVWIADRLRETGADIVGFQEVWHQTSLRVAAERSGRFPHVDRVIAPGANPVENEDDRGRAISPRVGLASRFAFAESPRAITEFPADALSGAESIERFARPVLRAVLHLPEDLACAVFVADLTSRRGEFATDAERDAAAAAEARERPVDQLGLARAAGRAAARRIAEAVGLRALILADLRAALPVIVLGDLGDGPEAVSTRIVTGEPPAWWERDDAGRPNGGELLLHDAGDVQAARASRDCEHTHVWNGRREVLDHVLVSDDFDADNPRRVGSVRAQRILNDHVVDGTLARRFGEDEASDHGIPVAEIRLDPAPRAEPAPVTAPPLPLRPTG